MKPALISVTEPLIDFEVGRVDDHRAHSWRFVVLAGVLSLALVSCIAVYGPGAFFGALTWLHAAIALGLWLLSFASATFLFHRFGPMHRFFVIGSHIELMARSLGLISMMVLSGHARVPLLFLILISGQVSRALPRPRLRSTLNIYVLTHAAALLGCLALGQPDAATVVFLSACAVVAVQTMLTRAAERSARARLERDFAERELFRLEIDTLRERIARELHDGLGSDLTALLLILRESAEGRRDVAVLYSEAQSILEALRTTVWLLKNSSATLDELGRLIDASCKRLCGDIAYRRDPTAADSTVAISASEAAIAARAAQELVRFAAMTIGIQRVTLRIETEPEVALHVDALGAENAVLNLAPIQTALAKSGSSVSAERYAGGLRLSARVLPAP